jgi:hypothetical protein
MRNSATGKKANVPPYERDPGGPSKGIKILAPLVAAILLPLLTPAPATAQDCISEITVIYGGSAGIQPPAGYTKINVDLNLGAGGDFIWLWYTKDPACTTIRNVHVQADAGAPPDGYTRIDVDLNRGVGGADIFLSYEEL